MTKIKSLDTLLIAAVLMASAAFLVHETREADKESKIICQDWLCQLAAKER